MAKDTLVNARIINIIGKIKNKKTRIRALFFLGTLAFI